MTMQMPDTCLYDEDEYYLLDPKFGQLFLRSVFGIRTQWLDSGCWRGFRCTYEIDDGDFCLHTLELAAEDGKYPLIAEIRAAQPESYTLAAECERTMKVLSEPLRPTPNAKRKKPK